MSDDNLFPTGQDSCDDDCADTEATDKASNKSVDNLPPPNGNNVIESGFFHFARNLIFAGVVATGIWLVGAQLHDEGYVKAGNVVNFMACIVFFTVLPIEAIKHWPRPMIVWPLFAVFLFGLAFIFFGLKPEPKSYPNFMFFLHTEGAPDDELWLTNSFVANHNFSGSFPLWGFLIIPRSSGQSVTLNFALKNDSSDADDVNVMIDLPTDWQPSLDSQWRESAGDAPSTNNPLFRQWMYPSPTESLSLLSGNSVELPQISLNKTDNSTRVDLVAIMVRAKGAPTTSV
ncbi:MAG: hypothetical protein ABSG87_10690, partial [Verrucomicrobiota bacterium]